MKRIGSRLIIVLIGFLLLVPVTTSIGLCSVDHLVQRVSHTAVGRHKKRQFKYVEKSCESGCMETYESPDGQQVWFTFACFSTSPAAARQDMQNLAAEGRIVQRRSWRNRRGKRVERTVALYPPDETGKTARILWYQQGDSCFSFIEAGSSALAREFERSSAGAEHLLSYSK